MFLRILNVKTVTRCHLTLVHVEPLAGKKEQVLRLGDNINLSECASISVNAVNRVYSGE